MKHTLSGVLTTHITLFTTSKINNLSKLTQILRKGFIDIEPVRNVIRLCREQMYYTRWWSQIHFVYPGIAYVESAAYYRKGVGNRPLWYPTELPVLAGRYIYDGYTFPNKSITKETKWICEQLLVYNSSRCSPITFATRLI